MTNQEVINELVNAIFSLCAAIENLAAKCADPAAGARASTESRHAAQFAENAANGAATA